MNAYMRLWIGMIIPTTWLKWSYLRISHLLTSKSQLPNILENICHPLFLFHLPYLLPLPLHIMKCLETAMLEDGAVLGIGG